jgi:hypothetical protein
MRLVASSAPVAVNQSTELKKNNSVFVCSQYDGAVSDFPDHSPTSNPGSSGSGHDGGSGPRWGGFTSYSEWKWHVLNKPNMDMLRNHKGTYKTTSSGKYFSNKHFLAISERSGDRLTHKKTTQVHV